MSLIAKYVALAKVLGVTLGVLLPAVIFALVALAPALRSLIKPRPQSPASVYLGALKIFTALAILAHTATGIAYLQWRPATGAMPAYTPVGDLDRFMRSLWNPWLDVVLDHFVGTGMPLFTGALAWIDEVVATVTLPDPWYALALALLGLVRWAGSSQGQYSPTSGLGADGTAVAWLRRAGWPAAGIGLVGSLIGLAMLPVVAATVALPATAWASAWVIVILLIGVLLSSAAPPDPEPAAGSETSPLPPRGLSRRQWEEFVFGHDLLLLRSVHGGGASALGHAGQPLVPDQPYLDGHPWSVAFEPPQQTEELMVLDGRTADTRPWPHQIAFVAAVREAQASHRQQGVLLHTQYGSGRSTAMAEAAIATCLSLSSSSLLIYADARRAREAHQELARMLTAAPSLSRPPTLVMLGTDAVVLGPQIVFAHADQIATLLLPSREENTQAMLASLELLGFEDVELYSGVRATNLVLVVRRLVRLLHCWSARPVLAFSLCANPTELTGAQEYLQALLGALPLKEAAVRDEAPRLAVYTYLLDRVPGRKDAQGQDELPPVAQVAWLSAAFGAPGHLRTTESLTDSDLRTPEWAEKLVKDQAAVLLPPEQRLAQAFVHVCEVPLREALSLSMRVAHGGVRLGSGSPAFEATEHLVVAVPSMSRRGLSTWLLKYWLRAWMTDGQASSGTWNNDIVPVGNRLVVGVASAAVTEQHLISAMAERPATRLELLALAARIGSRNGQTDAGFVDGLLTKWENAGEVRRQSHRRFDRDTGEVLTERRYAVQRQVPPTPLETTGNRPVKLISAGGHREARLLRWVDRDRLLRIAYPGRLFLVDRTRFRVEEASFLAAWQNRSVDVDLAITCTADDVAAFTEALVTRTWRRTGDKLQPYERSISGGKPIRTWRAQFEVELGHEGYREYREFGRDLGFSVNESLRAKEPLVERSPAWALAIELPESLAPNALATLRRMLSVCLEAVLQLDADDVELDVLAQAPIAPGEGAAGGTACILIRDPWDGSAALLDSLGADPTRFIEKLFKLVWLWADDLANGAEETAWDVIGFAASQRQDGQWSPDPAAVRDLMAVVLGTQAQRWRLEEDPFAAPPRPTATLPADARPTDAAGYVRFDAAAVLQTVQQALGGPIPSGDWQIDSLVACWEWMHAHISYRTDPMLYGVPEYVATPAETLAHRAGDCEDHANLLGSMAAALGATVRMVLAVDHACLQVALDNRNPEELRSALTEKFHEISRMHQLEQGQYPSNLGVVAKGWRREPNRGLVRTGIGSYAYFTSASDIVIDKGADGRQWLTLDTCSTRVLGSIDGLVKLASMTPQGKWRRGTEFVEWSPDGGAKVAANEMA